MWLDVGAAVRGYVERMVGAGAPRGMKALVLDGETAAIVSSVVPQSYLLEREVYVVDVVDALPSLGDAALPPEMACVCLLRPTSANIEALARELLAPRFASYRVYFTSFLREGLLERLAESDACGRVESVSEAYCDYRVVGVGGHACLLPSGPGTEPVPASVFGAQPRTWSAPLLVRTAEATASLLAGLRRCRPCIRYDAGSLMAVRAANEIAAALSKNTLPAEASVPTDAPPVLLVLDRRADLVTPLLVPWTYEALVHELFGLRNGRVSLGDDSYGHASLTLWGTVSSSASKDAMASPGTHVLAAESDGFFREHADATYGVLGDEVSRAAKALQATAQTASTGGSSEATSKDPHRFIAQELPAYRRALAEVERHVDIVTAVRRRVDSLGLLALSEAEQAVATHAGASPSAIANVLAAMSSTSSRIARLRLAALVALRFGIDALPQDAPIHADDRALASFVASHALPDVALAAARARLSVVPGASGTGTSALPGMYAFGGRGTVHTADSSASVYTAHAPPMLDAVDALVRGRLSTTSFPAVPGTPQCADRTQEIFVLFVNGSTHAEAAALRSYCSARPGVSAVLLSTAVHNTSSMLCELSALHRRFGSSSSSER